MQELSQEEFDNIMDRYPSFELSYETISHKKVSPSYNVCLAIPHGRKFLLWYTFYGTENVCLLLHINKDKKISKIVNTSMKPNGHLCLGTILYGSIADDLTNSNNGVGISVSNGLLSDNNNIFIIEDIYYYAGIPLKKSNFRERWDFIYQFMSKYSIDHCHSILISLPFLWENKVESEFECSSTLPTFVSDNAGYVIHHIQYRSFQEIMPYLNILVARKVNLAQVVKSQAIKISAVLPIFDTEEFVFDYSRPQYRYPTVFQVSADLQYDIYNLFAFGKNGKPVYYGVAGIPNYKTSIFMNSLFRKIKENANLDAIEESDDEEEFQDISEDKFVDLNKVELIECIFHTKFKKWIPVRLVEKFTKIVHITRLIKDDTHSIKDEELNPQRMYYNQTRNFGNGNNRLGYQQQYNNNNRTKYSQYSNNNNNRNQPTFQKSSSQNFIRR